MKKGLLLLFVLLSAIGLRAQDATVVADSLKLAPDTTVVASGKAYYFAERSKQYPIRFVAETDGFLTLSGTQKISASSIRRNGASLQAGGSMNYTDADGVKHTLDYFGAYTKESATGKISGIAVAKGDVVECKVSTSVAPTAEAPIFLNVEFTEGIQPLTLVGVLPENGSEWSGSMKYKSYGVSGAIYCSFSSMIDIDAVKASVTVGDKVYTDVAVAVEGYYSYLHVKGLADTLKVAAAEGLIAAGDQFTVTLSGLKDRVFSDVTLEDLTFTYTMGNTSCSGVTPSASTGLDIEDIQEAVFNFDGKVNIDNAKFYLLSLIDSSKVELTATVDGVNLTIPVASAIEGLLPRRFDIIAEGVTDAKGNALTWGSAAKTTEAGKLKVHYGLSNAAFAPTFTPAVGDTVKSLKTFTLTFPGKVIYNESLSNDLQVVLEAGNANSYSWSEVTTGTIEMSENGMEATITLAEEINTPSDYRMLIPKFFFSELGYDAENLSSVSNNTCYYYGSDYTYVNFYITPFEPEVIAPAPGSTVNKLDVIALAFGEDIDVNDELEAVLVSNEMGVLPDTIAVGTIAYDYLDNAKATITLSEPVDSAGNYRLVIPAGAIFAVADETRVTSELSYDFTVDPDYWDPEWVMDPKGTSQGSPVQLIAGRKYSFSDMNTYMTYTATEDGRLYFQVLDDNTYPDLTLCADDWYNMGNLAKAEDGRYWVGVEAGQTVYMTDYGFGARLYQVTFEAGSPYDALEYTGSFPVEGGLYSKSTDAPESYETGAVEFYFNTKVNRDEVKVYVVLPSKDNKKIEVTEEVSLVQGNIDYGKQPAYLAIVLADIIDDIKADNDLKAGDAIQVVLENVQDLNFAANALAESLTLNLTLAATVCTSINPNPEYGVDGVPTELSLRFDGEVSCASGKGWIIDVKSGAEQEFTFENFATEEQETWSGIVYNGTITLPEATIELTSKQFAIKLEGLKDAAGNVISYGDKVGEFVINYKMRDDNLKYVTADPENGSDVTSLKTTKLTFGEKVYLAPDAEPASIWFDNREVIGTLSIDPADEKSVIITWSEEITKAGEYYPSIPKGAIYDSKFDASKEDYGVADGAGYNPYISLEYYILADVSETTVASITPEPYGGWGSASLNSLPAEVVIEFDGNVKEVVNAYGERSMWSTRSAEIPEDATPLDAKLVDNKVIVTIPAEVISAISFGEFNITVNAIGEDGKAIGSADDPYAENIAFSYYVYKTLNVVESVPADGETVKELSTIKLTFDAPIFEIDASWEAPCLLNAESWEKVADLAYSFEGSEVTLTLAEPVTAAGEYIVFVPADIIYDDSYTANQEINMYVTVGEVVVEEDLAIVSANPENGATVENLTTVEIKLNKEVGYLEKGMLIGDNGEDAHGATLTQSETDPTVYTLDFTYGGLFENVELKKGVTYTMTLTSWASEDACNYGQGKSETVTLTYVGASEGFKYSALQLESITPAEDFVISDKSQNKFVVKFNGPVELVESLTYINMGQGATEKFESIVANDGQTEYTLTIAESVLAAIRGTVNIVLAANDLDGLRLQGNNGEGEYSTFAYYYTTTIGVPDLTVTPDAAVELASLATISIQCAEGLTPSWTAGNITLTDANGNAIALNDAEPVIPADKADDWSYVPVEWTVALKEELTAVGAYTLTVPAGYFNIGNMQGQVLASKETTVVFNITAAAQGIKGVTVDTEVKVYNVAGVAVAQGKASEVLKNLSKGIYIVNGKKHIVK